MRANDHFYIKALSIVNKQPWWERNLMLIQQFERDPERSYDAARSRLLTWLQNGGDRIGDLRPSSQPTRPHGTPKVSFNTTGHGSQDMAPPASALGTTPLETHAKPVDNNNQIAQRAGCGSQEHCFRRCQNPKKHDYRAQVLKKPQVRLDDRKNGHTWNKMHAYMTEEKR